MKNKIVIQLNNGKEIVAELCNYDGEHPEIVVCVQEDGIAVQDICIVRPHENEDFVQEKDSVDCIVWADEVTENYTDKFCIKLYEEEENYA